MRSLILVAGMLLSIRAQVGAQKPVQVSPEGTFNLAMREMSGGSYDAAEIAFRQVLQEDPDNPAALTNLGVLYSKTHRYTEAVDTYQHALRIVPTQEAIQLNLGLAYLKGGEYGSALPYFAHLHELHPLEAQFSILTATCLAYTGRAQEAVTLLRPLTVDGTENRAAMYLLGIAYLRADRLQEARAVLDRVFAEAPAAQSSFLLGEAYADATDYPSAIGAFQAALAADAKCPGAHRELGRAYLGMHQNEQAERELKVAVGQDPSDSSALYALGALLVQALRYPEGRSVLEQAQKTAPDSWATAFYIGKADLELHDMASAEKQLRLAATLNPDEPGAPYLLARLLRAQGHSDEANKLMGRVAALHATALDAEKRAAEAANREGAQGATPGP